MTQNEVKNSTRGESTSRRYEKFARHWLKHKDAAAAAVEAGYAPASAAKRGRELLQRQQVIERIEKMQAENCCSGSAHDESADTGQYLVNGKDQPDFDADPACTVVTATSRLSSPQGSADEVDVTTDKVLDELAAVAFASLTDVCLWEGNTLVLKDSVCLAPAHAAAVAEITETSTSKGGTLRVKMHSKMKALDMLCRALGMFDSKAGGAKGDGEAAGLSDGKGEQEGITRLPPEIMERIEALYAARTEAAQADSLSSSL